MTPNPSDFTMFGAKNSVETGNDLIGTFYAFNLDRQGRPIAMSEDMLTGLIGNFLNNDWSPHVFAPYFRSPNKMYATQIFIPRVQSEQGPAYFGVDPAKVEPSRWLVHYVGKFMSREGGKFRFRGFADDVLIVRVNRKVVLNATQIWGGDRGGKLSNAMGYRPSSVDKRTYALDVDRTPPLGDWFDLEAMKPADIEILIGEMPGGAYASMLVIEQYGVDYSLNPAGGPILPVFKTAETPEPVLEEIMYNIPDGKALLEGGPIFNVN